MNIISKSMEKNFTLKKAVIALSGFVVLAIVGYNMRDRILGTPLSITIAQNGSTVTTPFLPITGVAKHARELSINGRTITVDRSGVFDDEVLLSPGYNIIEVALKDQFGNEKVKTYQIVVSTPSAVATTAHSPYQ